MTVNNLAVLEREEGHLEPSAVLFRRALDGFVRSVGARHPNAVLTRTNRRAVEREIAALAARRPARDLKKRGRTRR
jgi:hypothetical protein